MHHKKLVESVNVKELTKCEKNGHTLSISFKQYNTEKSKKENRNLKRRKETLYEPEVIILPLLQCLTFANLAFDLCQQDLEDLKACIGCKTHHHPLLN